MADLTLEGAGALAPLVSPATVAALMVCGSVRGSSPVAAQLIADGFTDVVHVEGGFPAWQDAGLPTQAPAVAATSDGKS